MGEKWGSFLKKISRRGKVFLVLSIAILAASRFCYYIYVYAKKGCRRYAFAVLMALCFLFESSFAHPEQVTGSSVVSDKASDGEVTAGDSSITLVEEPEIEYENLEILKDEDMLEDCDETDLIREAEPDKYSLDEILNENMHRCISYPG